MSRRFIAPGGRCTGLGRGMVASQSVVQESQNDMYCSPISSYGEYYPDGHYYLPGAPPELCPAHTGMCTVHGDYGPVTVPMVSTNSSPPIAMPVQVPPGHVVQQIVDESGTLRHVILSPQHPAGLVPLPSHNPQHYGAGPPNGSNQPPQTFYPGISSGYPPPHFHSSIPPGHPSHVSSTHSGHSPPPSHGYYKDERTQQRYYKLRKKLHDKQQMRNDSGQNTPLLSPRKDVINGLPRNNIKEKGMNSVGTSEDGEESSSVQDEDDYVHIITDMLSSVQSPKVSELSSRSALLQWAAPLRLSEASSSDSHEFDISESDLRYEVLLSDKSKEMKYKSIYSGTSLSCRIQDLRPGQEYSVCLQVHLDELQGSASDPIKFVTPPCEPDQPQAPKLISRSKSNLQLRWNAVNDNGSHIQYYILEYDEGKGGDFVELHKSRGKQHSLSKLQPATVYNFRLAALNEVGKSVYSDVASFSTSDVAPLQPAPPSLRDSTINSLHLVWNRRPKDDEFVLQLDDLKTRYGYLIIYNGKNTEYICENLKRYTDYKFRLKAQNNGGCSPWSEEVTFKTLPDRPARPSKPIVKGRIHAHMFRLKWEPPSDTGGAEITKYILELNSGSGYQNVYTGSETEAVCDKLTPGTTYQLRVSCLSAGGRSTYSDPCTVTTDAISPGQCTELRLHGKPRPNIITIRWNEPDYNGGAPVLEYEVEMVSNDGSQNIVHKSKEIECTVSNVSPGCEYLFMVRAVNRIGPGLWSETLAVQSGAAPPDIPMAPVATPKSPFHIYLEWQEPNNNGASITEYKVVMSPNEAIDEQFLSIFQGSATNYDVRGLLPFTPYYFRVQACNNAGFSPFSPVSATVTPAAPPAAISCIQHDKTPTSITLSWTEPPCNGASISHYNIEVGDQTITTAGPDTSYTIESLNPLTTYKIKIQAVNNVGTGPFSSIHKASTLALPPIAPRLECVGIGHNYLKLKWGEGRNYDFTQYCVEMENPRSEEFQCVYQGTAFTYKVNKLQELTSYRFRISASNDTGDGDYSDEYEFDTSIAPPTGIKPPKAVEIEQRGCTLEWAPSKNSTADPIIYLVQVCRLKDQDFKQVYKGSDTKCTLENLEPGADYNARVCPIRLSSSGELPGPYSPQLTFSTAAAETLIIPKLSQPVTSSPTHVHRNRSYLKLFWPHLMPSKSMSDQQLVLVGTLLLILVGIVIAVGLASLVKFD